MTKLLGIFDFVPGWLYAATIAAILAVGCSYTSGLKVEVAHAEKATAAIQVTLESERRTAADRARQESEAARQKEGELQKKADAARKADQDEIRRIAAQRDRALDELRKRPARPTSTAAAGVPADPGAGQAATGCTGAQLYRDDAEFLVRQFARAETIRKSLLSCYAANDRARSEAPAEEVKPQTEDAPSNP